MNEGSPGIRALLYELGCALGAAGRSQEALEELRRALLEPGDAPEPGMIHLAAGELLERTDPVGAIERYIDALGSGPADETLGRVRRIIESSEGPTVVAALPQGSIDRLVDVVVDSGSSDSPLLAAELLRQRGRDERALDVLRHAWNCADARAPELAVAIAETMMDLGDVDGAASVTQEADPSHDEPALDVARATVALLRGDFDGARGLAGERSRPPVPAALAVQAFSLIGLGRPHDAAALLADGGDAPELSIATAVAHLSLFDYGAARARAWGLLRSRPNDPDALLINAQTVVEALGELEPEGGDPSGGDSGSGPLRRLESARRLLTEVAHELGGTERISRWWSAQQVVRGAEARYRFFRVELDVALGKTPTLEKLEDIDATGATALQDFALAGRRAEAAESEGDREAAAIAHEDASEYFQYYVIDAEQAWVHAQKAYEWAPTAARAVTYGHRTIATITGLRADQPREREALRDASAAADRWISPADDDANDIVHVAAWLRARAAQLVTDDQRAELTAAVPWTIAGLAIYPGDSSLRAMLSDVVAGLGHWAAADAFATDAIGYGSLDPYVVSTAIVARAGWDGTFEQTGELLSQFAELGDPPDDAWLNSITLWFCLVDGGEERMAACHARPVIEESWARRHHAIAGALLGGIHAAASDLAEAVELATRESEADAALLLACVLGEEDLARTTLAAIASDPLMLPEDLERAELTIAFVFETGVSPEEFFRRTVGTCTTPAELRFFERSLFRLLVAARAREPGPPRSVRVDSTAVAERLRTLADARAGWIASLDAIRPGLAALSVIAEQEPQRPAVVAAIDPVGGVTDPLLSIALRLAQQASVARAAEPIPAALLSAFAGTSSEPPAADIAAILRPGAEQPESTRAAVALLARLIGIEVQDGPSNAPALPARDGAAEIVLAAASVAITDSDAWWRLDEALVRIGDEPPFHELIAELRVELAGVLTKILGLSEPWWPTRERSILSFKLGPDLVPENVGPTWSLLAELIPAMQERVLRDTGFEVPGATVMPDALRADVVRLMRFGCPLEVERIPMQGAPELEGRAPLELVVAHVERFVRSHLASLVTIAHVRPSADGMDAESGERVSSDAALLIEWLDALREAAREGRMHDASALSQEIAERTLGTGEAVARAR